MADAIVPPIFESLSTALSQECSRIEGVKEKVELLQLTFRFMNRLLRDAEKKRKASEAEVEQWVTEIIVLAHDVEDVIDSYMLYLEQQKTMKLFFKIINIHNKLVTLHRFAKDIEAINARAQAISSLKSEYMNTEVAESLETAAAYSIWWRGAIHTTQETGVVGFQDQSAQVINLLKQKVLHRRVISIIGMGGLGKTTLAQMIYNDPNVINLFDTRVWVSVSQEYKERDVLLSAFKSFFQDWRLESMSLENLKVELFKTLSIRKYLLIVDDIWNVDDWDKISQSFPENNNGSRVLLTTRKKEVALHADPSHTNHHELRTLNCNESWELFLKKVFWMPDDSCPLGLERLGREIVHKCDGIPLAILTAGGLLMGKERTHKEWSRLNADLNLHLAQDSSKCHQILMLSYHDLPCNLKSCFLYLGMFPEDFEIPALRVIRLWVAEGFVQDRGHQSMEDVAEDYLEQLCQRSLIQVKRRRYHQGPLETFRVHDLLRELAISEGKKYQYMNNSDKYSSHIDKPRRLSVNLCIDDEQAMALFTHTIRSQRSLLFFHPKFTLANSWMPRFVDDNKLLRVLDLEGIEIKKGLPKEIGSLTFLHYLGLCFTGVKSLPKSIGNLIKLQTLDVRNTLITSLPKTIWKLKNLRHLLFFHYFGCDVKNIPVGKNVGNNLITLNGVSGMSWMNEDGIGLSNVFTKQKSLRSLHIHGQLVVSNCQNRLRNCFPMSLTELFLIGTKIEEDPSSAIGSLPLLKALYLQRWSYDGKKMKFSSGKFPQLQYLYIGLIDNLSEWTVEDGAVPILGQITLYELLKLKRLPDGLRNVGSLQNIDMYNVPRAERKIRDGETWDIAIRLQDYGDVQGDMDLFPPRITLLSRREPPSPESD